MSKGRGNASSITVKETVRLNLDYLVKKKLLVKGCSLSFKMSWSTGAEILLETIQSDVEKAVKLKYNYKAKPMEYKIQLVEVRSNLGKGSNLYFVCPVLGIKCKTLYCCYGSELFKSRQAYKQRIYYITQICSKLYVTTEKFWKADKRLNEMYSMRRTKLCKGKETKRYIQLKNLIEYRNELEMKKDEELERWLCRYLGLNKKQDYRERL